MSMGRHHERLPWLLTYSAPSGVSFRRSRRLQARLMDGADRRVCWWAWVDTTIVFSPLVSFRSWRPLRFVVEAC